MPSRQEMLYEYGRTVCSIGVPAVIFAFAGRSLLVGACCFREPLRLGRLGLAAASG